MWSIVSDIWNWSQLGQQSLCLRVCVWVGVNSSSLPVLFIVFVFQCLTQSMCECALAALVLRVHMWRHYSTFNAPFFFSQYLSHDISYTHLNIKFGLKTQSKNDQKVWFLPSTPFWPINKRRTKTCDIQFLLMVRFL